MKHEVEKMVDLVFNDLPLLDSLRAPADATEKVGDVVANFVFSSTGLIDVIIDSRNQATLHRFLPKVASAHNLHGNSSSGLRKKKGLHRSTDLGLAGKLASILVDGFKENCHVNIARSMVSSFDDGLHGSQEMVYKHSKCRHVILPSGSRKPLVLYYFYIIYCI